MMIKKKLLIIGILFIMFTVYSLLLPSQMTSKGYFDKTALKVKKIYEDSSLYNSSCKENAILKVAVYFSNRKKYKKCEEWIHKRNKCISLHSEYKNKIFRNYSSICNIAGAEETGKIESREDR